MSADKLLEMLDKAKESDLEEIDARVVEGEKQLDALRSLRRMIDTRINGRPQRKAREPKAAPAVGPTSDMKRNTCAKYLLGKPVARVEVLANQCGASMQGFHFVLNHPWFKRSGDLVSLTDAGRVAAQGL